MMNVLVIMTCFNRIEKTEMCIKTLSQGNSTIIFTFIVVDDNSTDGTVNMLKELQKDYKIHIVNGKGNLFYSGGMRMGMDYALNLFEGSYDYILMVNDDVSFYDGAIEMLAQQSKEQDEAVIVGAMCDGKGQLSYGTVKYTKGIKYRKMCLDEWNVQADTFNANCVLIPYDAFIKTGAMDSHYVHSLGDFDYGLELKRNGFRIYVSKEFAGICNNNPSNNTWTDRSLSRTERVRKKENVKGAPTKQWFYFLNKNFGIITAIKAICTPYLRILLGK